MQHNGGVFLPPWGKVEQWLLSVQHDRDDVDRFAANFARFADGGGPLIGRFPDEGRRDPAASSWSSRSTGYPPSRASTSTSRPASSIRCSGASGCGKTTTLRMIAGFEKPDSGRIELDGRDVAGDPPHKRPVNTVFQTYALFPFMTVWDNVAFGLKYQKASRDETKRRVGEALELVRMSDFAKRRPAATVRRPAAARRAGAGTGAAPEGAAARRAARCAGCQAAQAVTAGAAGGAARGRHHVRLRDPRPGGSAHDERPDRGAGRGPGRAGRPAAGDLLRACDHLRRRIPGRGQHL